MLRISQVIWVSLFFKVGPWDHTWVMLMKGLVVGPQTVSGYWAGLARKTNQWLEGWSFELAVNSLTFSRKGRVAGEWVKSHDQWHKLLGLCNITPVKTFTTKTQWCFQVGEHTDALLRWHVLPKGKDTEALCSGLSQTSSYGVWGPGLVLTGNTL